MVVTTSTALNPHRDIWQHNYNLVMVPISMLVELKHNTTFTSLAFDIAGCKWQQHNDGNFQNKTPAFEGKEIEFVNADA